MRNTDTVIIGAGHAGLALSHCLAERGVPHVVLDRGGIGQRWRTARWDSFRLLTPNWLSRLPGRTYTGPDPDGFMTAGAFVDHLCAYADSFEAPVESDTLVTGVDRCGPGFVVQTDRGDWCARSVVIATGYHSHALVPELADGMTRDVAQTTAADYRSPAGLSAGTVLVVGASSSGTQIAHELARDGRRVILAVGRHTRLPRRYRGRDILWWLDRTGALDRTVDEHANAEEAQREPSLQLTGASDDRGLDLGVLQAAGVALVGRLRAIDGTVASVADDLADTIGTAQQRLDRVLAEVDAYAHFTQPDADPPDPPPAVAVPPAPSRVDLRREGIASVVWATGYRPRYPWLRIPVLGPDGRIQHCRGVTEVPGLYAIGLRFQHRRNSTFIDGARHDARHLAELVAARHQSRIGV